MFIALPLIVACASVASWGCDRVVTLTPNPPDEDASVDVAVEEDPDVVVDPVEEEPESGYEFNTCLGACALQAYCLAPDGWPDPLPDDLCGAMCARLTSESRSCLDDAIETSDCSAFFDCQGELEYDCITVCEFMWLCYPGTLCHYYCPMYTQLPRDCAFAATASRDCGRAGECLMGHRYGATCHDACTMLVETCGVDAEFDSCVSRCSGLSIDSMSRACIDAATYWDDCEALAACGGLVP